MGGHISVDLSVFVLLYYTNCINKLKFHDFLKTKNKTISLTVCTNFLHSTKSSHFPLTGKVGQLSKQKRVLCWSIYNFSLWQQLNAEETNHENCIDYSRRPTVCSGSCGKKSWSACSPMELLWCTASSPVLPSWCTGIEYSTASSPDVNCTGIK